MGCQTSYSCPITIPQGNTGAAGPSGSNGSDGISSLINTIGTSYTSSGTGVQSLIDYETSIDQFVAKDVLAIEASFTVSSDFIGTISIKYDAATVGSYTVPAGLILPVDLVSSTIPIVIKVNINFKTASTQSYDSVIELGSAPMTSIKNTLADTTITQSAARVIDVQCNPSAGTVICNQFVITIKKI